MRAGVTIHSGDHSLGEILEYGKAAERLGYEGFWLTEESGKEAFSVLSVLSGKTRKIRLGTGIVNIYSRTPTLLSMSITTLDEICSGRAFLGLGTGGIGFITRGHGLTIEDPVNRMREYVAIIRKLLAFERITYEGKYFHIKNFQLRQEPNRKNIPIYLAGLNPKMQRLAGEVADGTIVNMLTANGIKEVRENIRIGAEKTGRDPSKILIYTLAMTLCGQEESAMDAMKKTIAFYCASPHYHHILESVGHGEEANRIKALWDQNKHEEAVKLVSEELVSKVSLSGTAKAIRKRFKEYLAENVYPIVYPIVRHGREKKDMLYAIRTAAGK